jgi:hypothetical protein
VPPCSSPVSALGIGTRQDSYNNLAALGQAPSTPRGTPVDAMTSDDSDVEEELISSDVLRHGVIACFDTFAEAKAGFAQVLELFPVQRKAGLSIASRTEPVNVLHICVSKKDESVLHFDDTDTLDVQLHDYLVANCKDGLVSRGIRRITFTLSAQCHGNSTTQLLKPSSAMMYTFRASIQV